MILYLDTETYAPNGGNAMTDFQYSDATDEVVCEICGGKDGVGIRRIMFDGFCCRHCLNVWYEGAGTDSDAVRAASIARQGRSAP